MVAVAEKESVDQALARLDVVPEPYRSAGIDVLLDRELITATGRGYRPSNEVIFSLRLDPWQY